jgi:short subunit dehydrogenase-like uncharacterized protein
LAKKHHLEYRVFALDEKDRLDAALHEVEMVLHCAGPFSLTSRPVVEACLRNKKHYTDITGELTVFEACAGLDEKAREAGVMIMPGVGFDVVPSDCLAVQLKNRLPTATRLTLAFYGTGGISHGTQSTILLNINGGGAIRKDGKIMRVPAAWKTQEIDFGEVTKTGVTIPWGDIATAYRSTEIPNIEVFTVVPPNNLRLLKASRYFGWLLATKPLQDYLQKQIPAGGPTDEQRAKGKMYLWGEASDRNGNRVESRMKTPEGYDVTARAALNIAKKILDGNIKPGYQTPAQAYGPDLILELEGVSREDTT